MIRLLALVESAAILAAVWLALALWAAFPADAGASLAPAAALLCCALISFYYNDLYDLRLVRTLPAFAARLPQALAIMLVLWGGLQTFWPALGVPMAPSLAALAAVVASVTVLRAGLSLWLRASRIQRVLILGAGPLAQRLKEQIEAEPHRRLCVAGMIEDPPDVPTLERLVETLRPHRIVVALSERRGMLPLEALVRARAHGIVVEEAIDLYERLAGQLAIESIRPSSIIFSAEMQKAPADLFAARALSLMAACAGLVIAFPLMAVIALAIKLDSDGPVFFRQLRVGWRGRRFTMIKFRTMRPVREEQSVWAQDNDARITRVGRVLRKFRLDELPQFFNILQGHMNLVGPRPHPEVNYRLFAERIPHYGLREAVRPGVTGWAQIRYAYANNLEEETEKMRYDLYYIKHMSVWFDLKILIDTVKVVLLGRESSAAMLPQAASPRRPARPAAQRGRDSAA
jgi:exopolysaccharide biosynthesis polyprenyl glycosylphosphotransferase